MSSVNTQNISHLCRELNPTKLKYYLQLKPNNVS